MEIVYKTVEELIPYANNPRDNENAVEAVAKSIQEFGFKVPIIIDKDNIIITGHTRVLASKQLGLKTIPTIMANDLTREQVKAFRLADNKTGEIAEWDLEKLDLELQDLRDMNFDIDLAGFGENAFEDLDYDMEVKTPGSLTERFIAPPFSVLDTRQGYWLQRKKNWLALTGNLSETRDGDFGKISGDGETMFDSINSGTSNFDPVLAEIMYKWFNVANGKILDPFGGEQTKGVVAGELGYGYQAVEFRQEQVTLNKSKVAQYPNVDYHTGDSNNISEIIKDRDFDFCLTSPPYYDLEVYSKDDMSALGTYEEFMEQYRNIFAQCYAMLKDNRFLVVKVGEIRNKKTGEYRSFVADNIKLLTDIGFTFYNDMILLNAIGTAPFRANNSMNNRKTVKVHQNVLVFYKGDMKKISEHFDKMYTEEDIFEDYSLGEEI